MAQTVRGLDEASLRVPADIFGVDEANDIGSRDSLKNAVQRRFIDLMSEGSSPTSAAVHAIRELGNQCPVFGRLPPIADDFDVLEQDVFPPDRRASSSAPSLTQKLPPLVNSEEHDVLVPQSRSARHQGQVADASRSQREFNIYLGKTGIPHHANRDVWRTFGIHTKAGRSLKRLYGGARLDPLPGAMSLRSNALSASKRPPQPEFEAYLAVNGLQAGSVGLQFRWSKNMFDVCRGANDYVRWGDVVQGNRVDACWLQVGDRFLPTIVNRTQLLRKCTEAMHTGGPKRVKSLPVLHCGPSESAGLHFCIGGTAFGA